jgi:hypothetical protein
MKAVEVEAHIADALEKGAKVVPDGKRTAPGGALRRPVACVAIGIDPHSTLPRYFKSHLQEPD